MSLKDGITPPQSKNIQHILSAQHDTTNVEECSDLRVNQVLLWTWVLQRLQPLEDVIQLVVNLADDADKAFNVNAVFLRFRCPSSQTTHEYSISMVPIMLPMDDPKPLVKKK